MIRKRSNKKSSTEIMNGITSLSEILSIRKKYKIEKKKVVFTNGVFDLLHYGHVDYLTKSKNLGDILIVGINSDNSVRRIKGEKRPIVHEKERALTVLNLKPVDFVVLFDEDTPQKLIEIIIPDILVKGADWAVDKIVGKEIVEKNGGVVKNIEFVYENSTTKIIKSITDKYCN